MQDKIAGRLENSKRTLEVLQGELGKVRNTIQDVARQEKELIQRIYVTSGSISALKGLLSDDVQDGKESE